MDETLTLAFENGILTAALSGEIDHHGAAAVRGRIDEALYRDLPSTLVIDIANVGFMDSSGLGLILGRYRKAKELGIPLVVANPTPAAAKIFRMAGIDRMIQITKNSPIRKDG